MALKYENFLELPVTQFLIQSIQFYLVIRESVMLEKPKLARYCSYGTRIMQLCKSDPVPFKRQQ